MAGSSARRPALHPRAPGPRSGSWPVSAPLAETGPAQAVCGTTAPSSSAADHQALTDLKYDDIRARAISRADLHDDVQGINASIGLIQRTRGGGWPTGPVSEDFNFVDLVWHECEFREGYSFTYAVYDSGGCYLGNCYLSPLGRRTPLTEELLTYDVDVSWWVTPGAYERGYYTKLYAALQHWIETAFPFTKAHYSNTEIPQLPG